MKLAETGGYEYHPASLAYPLLEGDELNALADDIKANGLLEPIVLLEGKVLDGRNRLRACVLRGIKPAFADYDGATDDESLEAYVASRNLHRRHLTKEQIVERAAERRERVVAARSKGESLQAIANKEGVSKAQVVRDLKPPVVPGGTTDQIGNGGDSDQPPQPPPTVTGTDGRTYPAKKPPKLCDRCKRVGVPVEGCIDCKALRAAGKKKGKPPPAEANGTPEREPGVEPAEETIEEEIKRVNGTIESFCRGVTKYVEENLPADIWLTDMNRREGVLRKFQDGCSTLRSCKCHAPCPRCQGTGTDAGKRCRPCLGSGRLPKLNYDQAV